MTSRTESLLIGAWGIADATPAQRAICRIIDGVPLGDLKTHPDTIELVGGAEAVARLPAEMPRQLLLLAAVRGGKSSIATAAAYRMAMTADLDGLTVGEVPRVSLLAPTTDLAQVAFTKLRGAITSSPALRTTLVREPTTDTLAVRHSTGREVEIKVVAAAKAGGSVQARWCAGCLVDEVQQWGGDESAISLDDLRSVVLPRLRPGAQLALVGSPWAPIGPAYDLVQDLWGKPSPAFVVLRAGARALNPTWYTEERVRELEVDNPIAYRTSILGEFVSAESGLVSPVAVRENTREAPLELPPDPGKRYAAAVDPSEGGARSNGFTLVLVEVEGHDLDATFRVALARDWRGLNPDAAWQAIATELRRYGVTQVVSDQYAASANADLARRHGLTLIKRTTTALSKSEMYLNLASLIHQGRVELCSDKTLIADLLSLRKRVAQTGGFSVVLPRSGDGRHCDYAPSLAAAVKATAHRSGVWSGILSAGPYAGLDPLQQRALAFARDDRTHPAYPRQSDDRRDRWRW